MGSTFSVENEGNLINLEDADHEMLMVFLCHKKGEVEVSRYTINRREKVTSLDNKTLFVSYGGAEIMCWT